LTLPEDSGGLLHWRGADTATSPLQLSTRYFSDHIKVASNVIQFYKDPLAAKPTQQPLPVPLISVTIPAGQKLVYIVLWSELDQARTVRWHSSLVSASDWAESSMKVFNACAEPIGILADKKQTKLLNGKSMDFSAGDWKEAFPVKIFRLQPETKLIFSSSWRVSPGRRELCFIGSNNGSISLRSLMDLAAPPPAGPPR
jgi:hypothetical protein